MTYIKQYGKLALVVLCAMLVLFGLYKHNQAQEARLQQAVTLSQAQANSVEYLQKELAVSKQTAELLRQYISSAQTGSVAPNITFVQSAPTVEQAADTVKERINNNDKTLPPSATEKTDRTVVVAQPDNKYQIGVYKANLYRNWEWSVGYGQHGGDSYVPIGLQRNYAKDKAVAVEYHYGGESGYEIKYVAKTNKLFFLF